MAVIFGLTGCAQSFQATRGGIAPATGGDVSFTQTARPLGVAVSNQTIAEDFLDLTFFLEGGARLPGLLRYEGRVRVWLSGDELSAYAEDVDALLARLRREAGIDIARVANPQSAQIRVISVPVRELQREEPGVACIIVPGARTWSDLVNDRGGLPRWRDQSTLGDVAIFIPTDTLPQEVRACLHEEIAQALGPANDLYRLPDSVFNDDNRQTILSPFDMVILRALYSRDLRSGMTRAAVARRLPDILAGINPQGRGIARQPRAASDPAWDAQISRALSRDSSPAQRRRAANRAVELAERMTPPDHRLGLALLTRGWLSRDAGRASAIDDFSRAYALHMQILGPENIRTAQSAFHVALEVMLRGNPDTALRLVAPAKRVAVTEQDAILLSGLYAVESRALSELGRVEEARAAKVDHLRWARYAYGDDDGQRARQIARLVSGELEVVRP